MKQTILLFIAFFPLLFSCQEQLKNTQAPAARDLALRWEHLGNLPNGGYRARFILRNQGSEVLRPEGWAIYFSQMAGVDPRGQSPRAHVEHLSGDFFRLRPSENMEPVEPGDSAVFEYRGGGSIIKELMAPSGPYIVFLNDDGSEQPPMNFASFAVAPFTRPDQMNRGAADKVPVPTPLRMFQENRALTLLPPSEIIPITPTPLVFQPISGKVSVGPNWRIRYGAGLEREARFLQESLEKLSGHELQLEPGERGDSASIVLTTGMAPVRNVLQAAGSQAYTLVLTPGMGIRLTGADAAGVFYAVQSLLALAPVEAWKTAAERLAFPALRIEDKPRFGYRGVMLDLARNFQPKEKIFQLLDLMAFYKLNKFHLHFSDDEGWRVEIPELPELTEVGARRGHTLTEEDRLHPSWGSGPFANAAKSQGTGFLSREAFIELLRYAKDRHIEVIPEIDMPGHSRAAIIAMKARQRKTGSAEYILHDPQDTSRYMSVQGYNDNVLCPCQESTYRFFETVVRSILGMYKEAAAPLSSLHIGGDEVPGGVWEGSPACERLIAGNPRLNKVVDLNYYFVERCSEILQRYDLNTAGWEEIALERVGNGRTTVYQPHPSFKDGRHIPYVWNNLGDNVDLGHRLANAGYPVVLCPATNLYFDLAYNKDPREPGLYWAAFVDVFSAFRLTPEDLFRSMVVDNMGNPLNIASFYQTKEAMTPAGVANILGIQGELWSEMLREPWMMEYQAAPKMLALAERAWAAQPAWAGIAAQQAREEALEKAWNGFANRLGQFELPRLDYFHGGIAYRLPPPGVMIDGGRLLANIAYPGLTIRYTLDGTEPGPNAPVYTEPVTITGAEVRVASFSTDGRKSPTITLR